MRGNTFFEALLLLLSVVILLGFGTACEAEEKVYEGDYAINAPEDLRRLSGYTEVTGDLIIGVAPAYIYLTVLLPDYVEKGTTPSLAKIRNLDGLESLETIGGDLLIGTIGPVDVPVRNPLLVNIDGLCNLTSVGGSIEIMFNKSLTNLDGLRSLQTIGKDLWISNNLALSNLDGLNKVTSVGGFIGIQFLPSLIHLGGFENLTYVQAMRIRNNRRLKDITGFHHLTEIDDFLSIFENKGLKSIDGLKSLEILGGNLNIYCNDNLGEPEVLLYRDQLIENGWTGCWDFTCDEKNNPVCAMEE